MCVFEVALLAVCVWLWGNPTATDVCLVMWCAETGEVTERWGAAARSLARRLVSAIDAGEDESL